MPDTSVKHIRRDLSRCLLELPGELLGVTAFEALSRLFPLQVDVSSIEKVFVILPNYQNAHDVSVRFLQFSHTCPL